MTLWSHTLVRYGLGVRGAVVDMHERGTVATQEQYQRIRMIIRDFETASEPVGGWLFPAFCVIGATMAFVGKTYIKEVIRKNIDDTYNLRKENESVDHGQEDAIRRQVEDLKRVQSRVEADVALARLVLSDPGFVSALSHRPPVGSVTAFAAARSKMPDGWLLCDGSLLARKDYPELFEVIGHIYDRDGNESDLREASKFRLPDFRGLFCGA